MRRLTKSFSRKQTLVPFSSDRYFSFFLFLLLLLFFSFFSRDSRRSQALSCPISLPLRSDPLHSFVAVRTKRSSLHARTATRRRNRRLRMTPELDKILLRKHRTFLPPSSTSPAILPPRFPVRSPRSFPLLPLRLEDPAGGCLAGMNLVQSGIGAPAKNNV